MSHFKETPKSSITDSPIEYRPLSSSDFHLRNIWNDVNRIKYHVQTISVSLVAIAVTLILKLLVFPLIGLA